MENKQIYKLLAKLVIRATDKTAFSALSPEQKAIAALEFFISTMTRSGAETFFCVENSYLYPEVEKGLHLLNDQATLQYFKQMVTLSYSGEPVADEYSRLQENIINRLFKEIRPSEEQYVEKNLKLLSGKL